MSVLVRRDDECDTLVSLVPMPIVYRADRALGCTIVVWDGDLTDREIRRQLRSLSSDRDWPPGPRHLVDATTLGTFALPDPELVELLYEGTNVVRDMRVAALSALTLSTQPVCRSTRAPISSA